MRTERRLRATNEKKRSDSTDQMQLGVEFQCQSGNYSDCTRNPAEDVLNEQCKGILMFSNKSSSCGSNCDNPLPLQMRSKKVIRKGWTLFSR